MCVCVRVCVCVCQQLGRKWGIHWHTSPDHCFFHHPTMVWKLAKNCALSAKNLGLSVFLSQVAAKQTSSMYSDTSKLSLYLYGFV